MNFIGHQKCLLLLALVLCGSALFAFEKQRDGVLFELQKQHPTDAQWLKIQVCSEDIIRVVAAPEKSFSSRVSLMAEKTVWQDVPWTVNDKGDVVEIATAKVTVRVNGRTGAVSFRDARGNVLLEEPQAGGKSITAATVMGEQTYHIRQVFASPADEGFYGLGAHQNAVWNYKGHDVDLWQYNIVDVNPFLVSSKQYGILWDNNSRTKFGDIREYQSLSQLKTIGADGTPTGFTAEYYRNAKFDSLYARRSERRIDYEFKDVCDTFPEGFKTNVKAVRWTGEIEAPESGVFKFRFFSSSYAKFWIDGKLVVDSWRQNWNPWERICPLVMNAGSRHTIKIEWIPDGGYIGVKYLPPNRDLKKNTISLYSDVADQIDYYFVHGSDADQVVRGYREITGKTPMMPKWAMGFWQCRQRYKSQEEILSTVKEYRKRNIPIDNIVQDWFYWKEDDWGSHDFDSTRYPDPAGMVKELHNDLNAHIMISVWPKFYVGTKHYDEFNAKGWLYRRNVEKGQRDWVGPGYVSTFYDPYNADARKLYWKQVNEKLFSKGFDAWWLDSVEPDIESDLSREETILRMGPTALGSASRYLNTFSLMNCKAVYDGQRQTNPDQRVFILTRSAFAGQQRYAAATWSGDVAARWYDLKAQVSAGLNFTIAGIPYWTTDIGGFAVEPRYERPTEKDTEEWRELNTRWFQFGTFCALFRSHGELPFREIYSISPEHSPAYTTMVAYDKLRYRLMPYIYSLAGMVTHSDYTIMRALVMDFGTDKHVVNVGDEFMFGPSLLVNPVTEYKARSRSVYLPQGTGWYEMKSGKYHAGGKTITADAPLTDIPVFIKAGSIIPCGPEIQYASEKTSAPVRLYVYAGGDATFSLYEDEDTNYNYEKGQCSTIPFVYDEQSKTLTIGTRVGEFPGMLRSRTFEIVWNKKGSSAGLDFGRKPDVVVTYDGTSQNVTMK